MSLDCAAEVRVTLRREEAIAVGTVPETDAVLAAVRFVTGAYVRVAFTQFESSNPLYTMAGGQMGSAGGRFPSGHHLDASAAETLQRVWTRLARVRSGTKAIAYRRCLGSVERVSDEDKLIDYWVGLEALFAPDAMQEIRFRTSLRIAAYLGSTAGERRAIYDEMLRSYVRRSEIVHGSAKQRDDVPALTASTAAHLRSALLRIVESDQEFDPKLIDLGLLDSYQSSPHQPSADAS